MQSRRSIIMEPDEDVLSVLKKCGGYYKCPTNKKGERIGPLVGYAGTYKPEGIAISVEKHYVGTIYANFAKAEEFPRVMQRYASMLSGRLNQELPNIDAFCGAPWGGHAFANMLGLVYNRQVVNAEKKTITLATERSREKSEITFERHKPESGQSIAIVEDVCNNLSSAEEMMSLIAKYGAKTMLIICLLNRSEKYLNSFKDIAIVSLVRMPIPEYKHDDLFVAADIATNNVVWKPKNEWPRLMKAMAKQEGKE